MVLAVMQRRQERAQGGVGSAAPRTMDSNGERTQRRGALVARWAARVFFGVAALLLIGLAEFLALKLLAG